MSRPDKPLNLDIIRFGEQVRRARRAKGMTQQELADVLDITSKSISYIERGENYPSPENIFRLAKTLDMSLDEVVFGTPNYKGSFDDPDINEAIASLDLDDRRTLVTIIRLFCATLEQKHLRYTSEFDL